MVDTGNVVLEKKKKKKSKKNKKTPQVVTVVSDESTDSNDEDDEDELFDYYTKSPSSTTKKESFAANVAIQSNHMGKSFFVIP